MIRGALAVAWKWKLPLLVWSLAAATVGVIIRLIQFKEDLGPQLLAGLFAAAWSVMIYFVVPVIVFRDSSVREVFTESASTFKDTWGGSLGAMGMINIFSFLLALAGLGLGGLTFILTGDTGIQLLATVLIGGFGFVFGLLVAKALSGVAKTALYVYATEGTAPELFKDMDFGDIGGGSLASARA